MIWLLEKKTAWNVVWSLHAWLRVISTHAELTFVMFNESIHQSNSVKKTEMIKKKILFPPQKVKAQTHSSFFLGVWQVSHFCHEPVWTGHVSEVEKEKIAET